MAHAVSLSGVSCVFHSGGRAVNAVDDVSLDIQPGEFFTLLGPSGSGKTTCLRMIGGFTRPTSGSLRIHGEAVDALPPYLRPVTTVFQDYALFPHMTVADNVAYSLMVRGVSKSVREQRAAELLELVRLPDMSARKPAQLSGGQRQRVALARALISEPKVLLLDEPLGALDLKLREQMQVELKELQRRLAITFVLVTHDQHEALSMSDRIGVFNRGRLEQIDTPTGLYERPATRFVAEFIGHGVFTPATLREVDGQVVVDTPLGTLQDVAECPLPCAFSGGECDVLLRADDIVHDDHAPVKAQIVRKAFRGSEFLYTLRLASGHTLMAHVPSHHDHRLGEWIGIRPEVDHVVTFNRACPLQQRELCQMPCVQTACPARAPAAATAPPSAAG